MAKGFFNPFILKKWVVLTLPAFFACVGFFIGIQFYNLMIGIFLLFAVTLLMAAIGNLLLKNPFTKLLEGAGILTLNIDSTGVIRPFIVKVQPPFIKGKFMGRPVYDVFDREAVFNFAAPKEAEKAAIPQKDGGIKIELTEEELNKGRFAFFHYPCLIFNSQINSIVTKDFISESEKETFAEHGILFLNRKVEELSGLMRDFGRYVVELTKPKTEWYKNPWVIGAVVIIVIILIALFAPSIMSTLTGAAGKATTVMGGSGAVTPLG